MTQSLPRPRAGTKSPKDADYPDEAAIDAIAKDTRYGQGTISAAFDRAPVEVRSG